MKYNKKKIKICLNVLLHYGQYTKLAGVPVKIIKNDGLEKYNRLVGKIGIVTSFEFTNYDKPLIVTFFDNGKPYEEYCFNINELEKIGDK